MENTIQLELRAIDFRDTNFMDNCNCAISKSVKRQLKIQDVNEHIYKVNIGSTWYYHNFYGFAEFNQDKLLSETKQDHEVIRVLTLTKA